MITGQNFKLLCIQGSLLSKKNAPPHNRTDEVWRKLLSFLSARYVKRLPRPHSNGRIGHKDNISCKGKAIAVVLIKNTAPTPVRIVAGVKTSLVFALKNCMKRHSPYTNSNKGQIKSKLTEINPMLINNNTVPPINTKVTSKLFDFRILFLLYYKY
jgi:hypothetical protein